MLGRGAIPLASAIVLVCILATSWLTFDRVSQALQTKDRVSHTWEVKTTLENVYGIVAAAESDVRAYMLAKDEPSFERYRASEAKAKAALRAAERLIQDNARQRPLIDGLRRAIARRYAVMRRSTDARRRTGSYDEAITLLRRIQPAGEGFRAMDAVRQAIEASNAEENRLLQERVQRSQGQIVQAEITFALSIVISIVLISTFGLLSNRLVVQREEAADEERAFRADLEREIERTREAERQLESTLVELRRSNEELQNFAFVASHDLQEPLRKIRAFSDRVRRRNETNLDDESKDSLRRVEAAAERMQRLILDLLELSRITTKGRPRVSVDLGKTIDGVLDDLQTRLEETGGRVDRGPLPRVVADPAQMRQLMQNVIANALKFRRPDVSPIVTIGGSTLPNGRVALEVRDNGIGFEEKYADRIFVVFQRLHGRGEYEGSGIGLAIVRKIVERHGGNIEARGNPGEGASFLFDLPGENGEPAKDARLDEGESV